jgi:hypothetical protein
MYPCLETLQDNLSKYMYNMSKTRHRIRKQRHNIIKNVNMKALNHHPSPHT